jgi:peptidoglycan hydrolase-like protein with peptidoglycan-binding domain
MFNKNLGIILVSGALAISTAPLAFTQTEEHSEQRSTSSHSEQQSTSSEQSKSDQSKMGNQSELQSQDDIRQAQTALQQKGFDPGPINGVMGQQTKNAITDFQRQQNLTASGVLDGQTAAALGISNQGNSNVNGEDKNRAKPGTVAPTEEPNQTSPQQSQPIPQP